MADPIELIARFDPFAGATGESAPRPLRRYVVLDVFTATPLQGNPLAVFTDARGLGGGRMQQLARELNLSETVFVLPPEREGDVALRIFTPACELPFAGHPVLGTAVVVGTALARERVVLETVAADVPVSLTDAGAGAVRGWMEQPTPSARRYEHERELLAALGLERSGLPVELYDNGPRHVSVEVADVPALAALAPDLGAISRLGEMTVSCFARENSHWRTRVFAPGMGVPEDPATGSAAGPLAVHLCRHGRAAFGEQIELHQGEEIGRPSLLHARVTGSAAAIERVEVGGCAVMLARAELRDGPS